MNSIKCPECNLTNWATATECKRCRYLFREFSAEDQPAANIYEAQPFADADQFSGQPMPPPADFESQSSYAPNAPYRPNYQQQNYQPTLKSGLAIASMVLGIVGFVTSILLIGVLIAPIGLVLGVIALVKAKKRPRIYGGKGFAIAGIVLSGLIVLFIPLIAAVAIPNLLAARRAANEGSAIANLQTLSGAEMTFMATGGGRCGDLAALSAQKLIDPALAKGEKYGYRFMVINLPTVNGGCELHAAPVSASTGTRSFYFSTEDGILRAAAKNGKFADANDAPIDDSAPTYSNQPEKIATR